MAYEVIDYAIKQVGDLWTVQVWSECTHGLIVVAEYRTAAEAAADLVHWVNA